MVNFLVIFSWKFAPSQSGNISVAWSFYRKPRFSQGFLIHFETYASLKLVFSTLFDSLVYRRICRSRFMDAQRCSDISMMTPHSFLLTIRFLFSRDSAYVMDINLSRYFLINIDFGRLFVANNFLLFFIRFWTWPGPGQYVPTDPFSLGLDLKSETS